MPIPLVKVTKYSSQTSYKHKYKNVRGL